MWDLWAGVDSRGDDGRSLPCGHGERGSMEPPRVHGPVQHEIASPGDHVAFRGEAAAQPCRIAAASLPRGAKIGMNRGVCPYDHARRSDL